MLPCLLQPIVGVAERSRETNPAKWRRFQPRIFRQPEYWAAAGVSRGHLRP
jgi:hypothetical protein